MHGASGPVKEFLCDGLFAAERGNMLHLMFWAAGAQTPGSLLSLLHHLRRRKV
jgi:hypothetical protein